MKPLRKRTPVPALSAVVAVAAFFAANGSTAYGQAAVVTATFTDNGTATSAWNVGANWSSNPNFPSGTGAGGVFTGPTVTQTVNLTAAITVGSLAFDNNTTLTRTLAAGGGTLTLDAIGAGPATILVNGTGGQTNTAGALTLSANTTLTDSVVATVNQTNQASTAGGLNLTATMSGPGGFTKTGDGLATFGTNNKTYTGPTVMGGGRMRISSAAFPTGTSGFTINAGAQVELITSGTFTFNSNNGSLNLNGVGATSGPFAIFPGALRNTRAVQATITNPVVLQSDTLVHVQATAGTGAGVTTANGFTAFSGVVSGPGRLTLTSPNSDADQGFLVLSGSNTYAGGTLVAGGILQVSGAAATLGTGPVTIDNATSPNSIARLQVLPGVGNAVADNATLSLSGGGTAGAADRNFADLAAGVNDVVGSLVLGGVTQTQMGTYGSTASPATFKNDEFFTGAGVVSLIPEPSALSLAALGGLGLLARRRRRRRILT